MGTMLAFAANSLLTRMALQRTAIDPASFTAMRLGAGALTLAVVLVAGGRRPRLSRQVVLSAALLFTYAAGFSFAYRGMDTGAGALVLFASAQLLMICYGYTHGEKTNLWGVALALGGLVMFLAPATDAQFSSEPLLMLLAGLAWGGFSLVGRAHGKPLDHTAMSFVLAVPLALALLWCQRGQLRVDTAGLLYAGVSGSITSAFGYVLWYWVRVRMAAITAGTMQLSVPLLSTALGVMLLGESISVRGALGAVVVVLGVGLTSHATRSAVVAENARKKRV